MDTPESDISSIQSGAMEPLPRYNEHDDGHDGLHALLAAHEQHLNAEAQRENAPKFTGDVPPTPIDHFPERPPGRQLDAPTRARQTIVKGFFDAITKEQDEAIAFFITKNLVTANTTAQGGRTPLLAAVATRNVRIVQELLDFGAEPDAFGIQTKTYDWDFRFETVIKRTPLQLAAAMGHLPLVKLFMEVYHCDDSIVAPDGQIALRLAAANGHREVVDYLPTRRGGGFLRWQTQHKRAILRCKKALKRIARFIQFFVWDVEKFLLWTVPKEVVVKPLGKGCRWCWNNRQRFGPWCKSQAQQIPIHAQKLGRWVWKAVKTVPTAARDAGKATWKFLTDTLPRWLTQLGKWLWNFVTVKIPRAAAIVAQWIWSGVVSTAKALWDITLKIASLLHTLGEALLTFFRDLTLTDIWHGIRNLLEALFITLPTTLASWTVESLRISYHALEALFGALGACLWWIGYLLVALVVYVPTQLWLVLQSLGASFAKAWYEVLVWVQPKA